MAAGEFAQARAALDLLAGEQERHLMGEDTAFGLPRRLHSVHLRLAKALGDEVSRTGYQYLLVPPPDVLAPYGRFSGEERRLIAAGFQLNLPRRELIGQRLLRRRGDFRALHRCHTGQWRRRGQAQRP